MQSFLKNRTDMGKITLRKICIEYLEEILFGVVLLACVIISYCVAPFIPIDIFRSIVSPTQNVAIITVALINTWAMARHSEGIHVRYVYAWISGVFALVMILGVSYRMYFNAEMQPADGIFAFEGWEMMGGDLIAWLLLAYPSELLRPGWLTWKNGLKRLLPVVVLGAIDMVTPLDLRWLLALVPVVWVALLLKHLRDYRRYSEENYGSVEQTDEKWVIRYLVMILVSGISYTYLCFSNEPTRFFTQQWLMFFIFVYTNDQIIFRSKPWTEEEEEEEEEKKEDTSHYTEYRAALDAWMQNEKPYLNPDFRLTDLRQVLPLNRTYLSQFIHAEYECNFYQLVTNYRIEEAKRLMREHPEMQLQDVAKQSGFSSPVVFSRTFTRDVGITPSAWSATIDNS